MKLTKLFCAAALVMLMAACGSQKAAQTPTPPVAPVAPAQEEMSEGSVVIDYALLNPDKRAYGDGSHFQEATARRLAEANARAALAAAIQTKIKQALDSYAASHDVNVGEPGISQDQSAKLDESMKSISEECVTNTVAVKFQRYRMPNNQVKVYVCIEHRLSTNELVKQVAAKVAENIPAELKEQINIQQFAFEKKMGELFADYKAVAE